MASTTQQVQHYDSISAAAAAVSPRHGWPTVDPAAAPVRFLRPDSRDMTGEINSLWVKEGNCLIISLRCEMKYIGGQAAGDTSSRVFFHRWISSEAGAPSASFGSCSGATDEERRRSRRRRSSFRSRFVFTRNWNSIVWPFRSKSRTLFHNTEAGRLQVVLRISFGFSVSLSFYLQCLFFVNIMELAPFACAIVPQGNS